MERERGIGPHQTGKFMIHIYIDYAHALGDERNHGILLITFVFPLGSGSTASFAILSHIVVC